MFCQLSESVNINKHKVKPYIGVSSPDSKLATSKRLSTLKILDSQTHFKPTETFQYTHFSSCHPFNTKKGFIKGEALRILKTNSVKENQFYK